ncbi:hypothetical protein CB1_001222010 [Camelus ferus]|nr:hypothetical protein CB1_001222010 [Camelus ferus]
MTESSHSLISSTSVLTPFLEAVITSLPSTHSAVCPRGPTLTSRISGFQLVQGLIKSMAEDASQHDIMQKLEAASVGVEDPQIELRCCFAARKAGRWFLRGFARSRLREEHQCASPAPETDLGTLASSLGSDRPGERRVPAACVREPCAAADSH